MICEASIRLAGPDDPIDALQAIERRAATLLVAAGHPVDAEEAVDAERLRSAIDSRRLWVAVADDGQLIGFALAGIDQGYAMVEEMDVLPEHARRGIGSALLEAVLGWAARMGHTEIGLTTFASPAFNAPFYGRRGFLRVGDPAAPLAQRLQSERARGWGDRVAMTRDMIPEIEAPLFQCFERLGIEVAIHRHPPVRTVAEAKALRGSLEGQHIKNLFLKDRKKHRWMLTAHEDRELDLKKLGKLIGARGGLSFASPQQVETLWGVQPGAVTPFGAIWDDGGQVKVLLDEALRGAAAVHCHPLHNRATVGLSADDLQRLLVDADHEPEYVELSSVTRS